MEFTNKQRQYLEAINETQDGKPLGKFLNGDDKSLDIEHQDLSLCSILSLLLLKAVAEHDAYDTLEYAQRQIRKAQTAVLKVDYPETVNNTCYKETS